MAIRERVLGPDHPATAQGLNNLGFLLYAQSDLATARLYLEHALEGQQSRGDRYQEAVSFFNLGGLAVELGRVLEGIRLVALCFLIGQGIGHADTEQDWRNLTNLTTQLAYSQEQLDELLRDVATAY